MYIVHKYKAQERREARFRIKRVSKLIIFILVKITSSSELFVTLSLDNQRLWKLYIKILPIDSFLHLSREYCRLIYIYKFNAGKLNYILKVLFFLTSDARKVCPPRQSISNGRKFILISGNNNKNNYKELNNFHAN